MSDARFRDLARKIEPNVDAKYAGGVSDAVAAAPAGSGLVGLLHTELEKEIAQERQVTSTGGLPKPNCVFALAKHACLSCLLSSACCGAHLSR